MWRITLLLTALLSLYILFPACVSAADTPEETMTEEGLRSLGYYELFSVLPDEADALSNKSFSWEALGSLAPEDIFSWLFSAAKEKAVGPVQLFLKMMGILLLASMTDCFPEQNSGLKRSLSTVSALTVIGVLAAGIIRTVSETTEVIEDLSLFMLSFIPVFAGAAAASGKPAAAMAYQTTVFAAVQLFSRIVGELILPLCSIFLALGFTSSVTDVIRTDAIAKGIKTCSGWILSLCLTVFIGLLTLKGFVAAPADGLAVRTTKFALSTFVPVVGSALSEAYASLFGCMGVVRSTIGVFGIIVMAVVLLPVIISLLFSHMTLNLTAVFADMLSQTKSASVIRSCSSALSVLMAMIICYGMMILVSVALILLTGTA